MADKATDDCVSEKIPKLIAEGYDQDQAVAIAYSMCGEKEFVVFSSGFVGENLEDKLVLLRPKKGGTVAEMKAYTINKSNVVKTYSLPGDDDDDEDDDKPDKPAGAVEKPGDKPAPYDPEIMDQQPGQVPSDLPNENPGANPMGPGDDGDDYPSDMPEGAACAQFWIQKLGERIQNMEPEVIDFWQDILDQVTKWAADRYPDLSFGAGGDGASDAPSDAPPATPAEQDAAAKEDDEEETEEALNRYRNPRTTSTKPTTEKRMNKQTLGVVTAAAEHLHDLSTLEPAEPVEGKRTFCRMCAKASRMHAMELDQIVRAMDQTGQQVDQPATMVDDNIDSKAILDALRPLQQRNTSIEDQFFQLTGQKL